MAYRTRRRGSAGRRRRKTMPTRMKARKHARTPPSGKVGYRL